MGETNMKVNVEENTLHWTFQTEGGIASSPVCANDVVYFGSKDGNVYAVDMNTHRELWKYNAANPILCQVAVTDKALYFGSREIFYALDIHSGKELWNYDVQAEEAQKNRKDQWDYHDASPVVDRNIVYFGSGVGSVFGFDVITGTLLKEFKTKEQSAVRSTPLIKDDMIYFGDWNGRYYAFNIETEQIAWVNQYNGSFVSASVLEGDTLFFGGRDTSVHAVYLSSGKEKWNYIDPEGSWITGDPTVHDKVIFYPTSDALKLYAFDLETGSLVKSYEVFKNSFSKAVIDKDIVYVTSGDAYQMPGVGALQAYQTKGENTDCIWNITVSTGGIFTSPVIWKDMILFGSEDGCLHAVSKE